MQNSRLLFTSRSPLLLSVISIGIAIAVGLAIGNQGDTIGYLLLVVFVAIGFFATLITIPISAIILLLGSLYPVIMLGQGQEIGLFGLSIGIATLMKDGLLILTAVVTGLHLLSIGKHFRWTRLDFLVLLFVVWVAFIGIISSRTLIASLLGIRATILYVLVYFITRVVIRDARDVNIVIWAVILTSVVPIIASFGQADSVVTGLATIDPDASGRLYNQRLYLADQSVHTANVYAAYLAIVFTTIVGQLFFGGSHQNRLARTLLMGYSVPLAFFLIISFSRRVWIALGIVLLALMFIRRIALWRILSIALIVTLVLFFLPEQIVEAMRFRAISISSGFEESGMAQRVSEWRLLLTLTFSSPTSLLVGSGFGLVGSTGLALDEASAFGGHNYYLILMYQLGLGGLLIFLRILWKGLTIAFETMQSYPQSPMRVGSLVSLAGMVLIIISALAGGSFENYPLNLLFWLMLALAVNCQQLAAQSYF